MKIIRTFSFNIKNKSIIITEVQRNEVKELELLTVKFILILFNASVCKLLDSLVQL